MRMSFYGIDSTGTCGVTATKQNYDGQPFLSTIKFDYDLRAFHRDRFAVASTLLFADFISDSLEFPEAISPYVASAIEQYLDRGARVVTVDFEPYAAASGFNVLSVDRILRPSSSDNVPGAVRTILLDLLPSDIWFGSAGSIDHVIAPTSASLLIRRDSTNAAGVIAGAGLMFADALFADVLELPSSVVAGADGPEVDKLALLLRSCNVELRFGGV